jgi:hypothetical protein
VIYIERTFDRIPHWDDRNEQYLIREIVGSPEIRQNIWDLPECLDQGTEGACVGFGWEHELLAEPDRVTGTDPRSIFHRAQQLDDIPGENYEGSTVLGGAKAVQELGHLTEYRWAKSIQDVLAAVSTYGPVVAGIDWYTGMDTVDKDGFIRIRGTVRGGHCVCLHGVVPEPSDRYGWALFGTNSWGPGWGKNGRFKITARDFERLMNTRGEVCVPVVRTRQPAPPIPDPTPSPVPTPTPTPDLHPATEQLLELFAYSHLPEHLQEISRPFHDLAWAIAKETTQRGAEQTTCLRKLLEAKDCAVRMKVPLGQIGSNSPPL